MDVEPLMPPRHDQLYHFLRDLAFSQEHPKDLVVILRGLGIAMAINRRNIGHRTVSLIAGAVIPEHILYIKLKVWQPLMCGKQFFLAVEAAQSPMQRVQVPRSEGGSPGPRMTLIRCRISFKKPRISLMIEHNIWG